MSKPKRLERDLENKVLFGVCGGIANYFETDVTMIRVVWVWLTLFLGLLSSVMLLSEQIYFVSQVLMFFFGALFAMFIKLYFLFVLAMPEYLLSPTKIFVVVLAMLVGIGCILSVVLSSASPFMIAVLVSGFFIVVWVFIDYKK